MTDRERFIRTMKFQPVDRPPLHLVGPWPDTVARWRKEGLPPGADVHEYLGLKPFRAAYVGCDTGLHPPFQTRVLREDDAFRISIDNYGRTVREFKEHTSMPEWIEFPVKNRDDLQRVLDEHYRVDHLDERFPPDWEKKVRDAARNGELLLVDGGCYYFILRSLTGVEVASYLFYDAPDLVHELFARYNRVVMEGIRRASDLVQVDVIGFGEDIAYKSGPLVALKTFREFIFPHYKRAMDFARSRGIELTWYDSDGDLRLFFPQYFEIGIDCFAPCEVAAGMQPVALREQFGRRVKMIGGIDKREIARGKEAIDAELARLKPVMDEGGYIPAIDHSVSADISFDNYRYFIDAIRKMMP
ncbi:MAG: hypothetical protein HY360_26250 [Verrucomicrobia bacterium]|nr:hypothetical protein [Verrucomicrobiota bacterium]